MTRALDTVEVVELEEPRRLCGSRDRGTETLCTNPAGQRTPHPGWGKCWRHAGATVAGSLAAAKQEATAALEQLPAFGELVDITPHEAIVFMVRRSAGMVAWLEAKVQLLDDEDMFYENQAKNLQPNPWLTLLSDERDRLVKYAKTAADAGVAERAIQLAEQQGAMVANVLRSVLDQMGLDEQQRAQANALLYNGLRQLGSGEST